MEGGVLFLAFGAHSSFINGHLYLYEVLGEQQP